MDMAKIEFRKWLMDVDSNYRVRRNLDHNLDRILR